MLLSEWLLNKKLWETLKIEGDLQYVTDTDFMDLLTNVNHGERVVFYKFEEYTVNDISKFLLSKYKTSWDLLNSVNLDNLNLLTTETSRNEVAGKVNNNKTVGTVRIDKVSVLNDVDLIDDTGSDLNSDEVGSIVNTESVINSKENVSNININLENLKLSNIMTSMVSDVANLISLSIY